MKSHLTLLSEPLFVARVDVETDNQVTKYKGGVGRLINHLLELQSGRSASERLTQQKWQQCRQLIEHNFNLR